MGLRCCVQAFLVVVSRGCASSWCMGFPWWLLLLQSTGSRHAGFSGCGPWALGHRLSSCGTMLSCSAACDIFPDPRDHTCVSCIGRWILNHYTTRAGLTGKTKKPPAMQEMHSDVGSIPGGNGNPPQYPCLKNPMERGAWWATVHDITIVRHD